MKKNVGFTLSELLIALAILGVIATFTIPKVLQSQQDGKRKALAKEMMGTVSQAYQAYLIKNTVRATTSMDSLTPYMNYVRVDTTSVIDDGEGGASLTCNGTTGNCLKLHGGGVVFWWTGDEFCGTSSTNAIFFHFDPDGQYSGVTTGSGKSIGVWIYTNGKLRTFGTFDVAVYGNGGACAAPQVGPYGPDPTWFSWN